MKDEDKTKERLIQELVDLRQRIAELEASEMNRKRAEEALRESEKRFRDLADLLPEAVYEIDLDGNFTFANQRAFQLSGYSQEDLKRGLNALQMFIPEDRGSVSKNISRILAGEDLGFMKYTAQRKDGSTFPVVIHSAAIIHESKVVGLRGIIIDITERKQAEEALREREAELVIKTNSLEEVNTALGVLLKKRDEDKTELEEKVVANVKELVVPFLEKVKKSPLDPQQVAYLNILESNLNAIISPFLRTLSTKYVRLTPTEIQVANLIKEGKSTKEIGEMMTLSPRTIETHRKNIRKKLGIGKKKGNLRSHLLSFQ